MKCRHKKWGPIVNKVYTSPSVKSYSGFADDKILQQMLMGATNFTQYCVACNYARVKTVAGRA